MALRFSATSSNPSKALFSVSRPYERPNASRPEKMNASQRRPAAAALKRAGSGPSAKLKISSTVPAKKSMPLTLTLVRASTITSLRKTAHACLAHIDCVCLSVSLYRSSVSQHPALQSSNLVRDRHDPCRVVRRDHHCSSAGGDVANPVIHEVGSLSVQTVVRLVEQQDAWLQHLYSRYREP